MSTDTVDDGTGQDRVVIPDDMKVDIRRYCGFPAYGFGSFGYVEFALFLPAMQVLELRMNSLTKSEYVRISSYFIPNLMALEDDLLGMRQAMIVDTAAVFKRNANEAGDRHGEFNWWRRHLCAFLGINPGPNFNGGGSGIKSARMVV